jgi:hypothetical protein
MKNPNQIVRPTAAAYLDSLQQQINILRGVHPDKWQDEDLSQLHEIEDILDNAIAYFEDLDAEVHEPNPDDYEPEY